MTATVCTRAAKPVTGSLPPDIGDIGDLKVKVVPVENDYWKLCNGQSLSRTTYAALFAAIGTSFGAGDGTTTFNLPDARGRAIGIAGNGAGLTARSVGASVGAETHTLSKNEMPNHDHVTPHRQTGATGFTEWVIGAGAGSTKTTEAGVGQAHNNMQPTLFAGYLMIRVL